MTPRYLELVCPAGTPAALRAAIEAGADTVYCGFADATNARNYPGLNFDRDDMKEGIAFAHRHGRHVLVAINTFPRAGETAIWHRAVDDAAALGADAVILADIGVLDYASRRHPDLRLHLSVQAAASNPISLAFYRERFGIRRAVLPRVLTVPEIAHMVATMGVEAEVFAFGSLGTMTEGRCILSSYMTGRSPSSDGVCAPAEHVRFDEEGEEMVIRLGGITMNRFPRNQAAAYPTPCKARLVTRGVPSYLFDEPVGLNVIDILPSLKEAGVTALKIEGRQRSRAYVTQVVRAFRAELDALDRGAPSPGIDLSGLVEGGKETFGAYKKGWR
ncbi:MAG: U32 family peptidase [Rhodospirillales bacterium]|nr:U32 family peptidase [Rhodospirillales bacterium]MDE2199991.1 U32 family peptidase [Rhodospirillales bacterium]MDE2576836.1 U32 family peptidase [Rhodospirillales bacterium]